MLTSLKNATDTQDRQNYFAMRWNVNQWDLMDRGRTNPHQKTFPNLLNLITHKSRSNQRKRHHTQGCTLLTVGTRLIPFVSSDLDWKVSKIEKVNLSRRLVGLLRDSFFTDVRWWDYLLTDALGSLWPPQTFQPVCWSKQLRSGEKRFFFFHFSLDIFL